MRVVRHWPKLPREVVDALSLEDQHQTGWGFEQLDLVQGVPARGSGVGARCSLRSLSKRSIIIKWLQATRRH